MYLGDYVEDSIVDFKFSTEGIGGIGITPSPVGTVSVYNVNDIVQSVVGVVYTVDFDSITGIHHVRIDLSSDIFYDVANDYQVVVTGLGNEGKIVNVVLANFSISRGENLVFALSENVGIVDSADFVIPALIQRLFTEDGLYYIKLLRVD